ncbi:hypothetical protein D9757_005410 [Collybiopsis confluens]|uniref:WW domain-containing protein n=1 Tax=Collybiopsis confluens TaxID=2823264 RepID=A0A8H5HLU2_9AGAR|nr:hypothetical protein D9757_005410 [Collybiopsis confluens]
MRCNYFVSPPQSSLNRTTITMSSSNIHDLPLPGGWIKQYHESGHPYYVDTKANPPRSIWTHPYQDEQYLQEHPESREKLPRPLSSQGPPEGQSSSKQPDVHDQHRRHSYNGQSSKGFGQKRGFFGKLKDKAIGTKEEREAEKARAAQLREQRRQQFLAQQQAQQAYYAQQAQYGPPPQQYGAPYSPYGGGFGQGQGYASRRGNGMGGMGGMALPLVGGLAGGLLLGEALGGDFGGDGGGDFGGDGGGDFGGGDFGGGDFGGGF